MNLLFIPCTAKNPYQRLLQEALFLRGINVFGIFEFSQYCFICHYMKHIFKFGKPAILHIHWLHPFIKGNNRISFSLRSIIFISSLKVIRASGVKIVWTVHNLLGHDSKHRAEELFYSSKIAGLCERLITHSASSKQQVLNTYSVDPDKITVIPHGNFITCYENSVDAITARKKLDINVSDKVFLYFGRVRPYKGITELLDAFRKLDRKDTTLMIAGTPQSTAIKSDLLKQSDQSKNIRIKLEYIPDKDIQLYMNAADYVVLPFRDIFTSGSVILAMSFAKPVIAPAIGSITDTLDESGGILYDPNNNDALSKSMEKILEMNTESMGIHNYEKVRKLDWESIANQTVNVYKSCLESPLIQN